jgi:hypothetical protein
MKIVRRLIASALYRVAEEVDPEPEVVAWLMIIADNVCHIAFNAVALWAWP